MRSETHSAGALRGFTVEVLKLLGGVTGEMGQLELDGMSGVNPVEDGAVTDLVEAKAVRV